MSTQSTGEGGGGGGSHPRSGSGSAGELPAVYTANVAGDSSRLVAGESVPHSTTAP